MDTYGIINLTELDRNISELDRRIEKGTANSVRELIGAKLVFEEIKDLCLKLPSAEKVFIEGRDAVDWKGDDRYTFEEYITQFIKSDDKS